MFVSRLPSFNHFFLTPPPPSTSLTSHSNIMFALSILVWASFYVNGWLVGEHDSSQQACTDLYGLKKDVQQKPVSANVTDLQKNDNNSVYQ